jgi:predicted nucleotide-binding protein (sugar kinase/HSP70/actin superfamily)
VIIRPTVIFGEQNRSKRFAISSIRVKKFCANSVFNTVVESTGFVPPVPLEKALEKTARYEFIESHEGEGVFYSE